MQRFVCLVFLVSSLGVAALLAPVAPVAAQTRAITTDRLNLRTGPGLQYGVILVMPAGASVLLTGESSNGFRSVDYDGVPGWASADYLTVNTNTATVTESLNLRTGPSLANGIILVMPAGSILTLTGESANGFLSVDYDGVPGWAFAAYLDSGGNTATTTDRLNLRTGPSLSDPVILVIPAGATVALTGDVANGFLSVIYDGVGGWAYGEYLV